MVLAGVIVIAWPGGGRARRAVHAPVSPAGASSSSSQSIVTVAPNSPPADGPTEAPVDTSAGEPSAGGPPEDVSGEIQLDRRFRGVIAAGQEALQLPPAEVDRLVADFMEFQEVNAEVVARHMTETAYDPTSVTVHVPAFPSEGKALRDLFYRRLQTDFTPEQLARIDSELGHFVEAAFRGFGIAEQTYTITKSAEHPGAFEVKTEVVVPDGVITSSTNPDVAFGGVSDTMLVTREQLTTGEYRFLGSVVEKRFSGP